MTKEDMVQVEGIVIESLRDAKFRVDLGNNNIVMAYTSGKIRINQITIMTGDKVIVELSPYDLTKGRIVRRLK